MTPLTTVDSFEGFGLSAPLWRQCKTWASRHQRPFNVKLSRYCSQEHKTSSVLHQQEPEKPQPLVSPLVENIDAAIKDTQALVMSPTRELALQVAEQLTLLGKKKGVRVVTIYGGSSYRTQIEGIRRGAHIIVATPGRLVDFLEQKIIKLQK